LRIYPVELEISFMQTIAREELVRTLSISMWTYTHIYMAGRARRKRRDEGGGEDIRIESEVEIRNRCAV